MLPGAIASALEQSVTDLRVLVSDNASTDATPAVVAELSDPRVTYVRRSQNLGWFGNFNVALSEVQTPFVTVLNDDDLMVPGALERALLVFEEHPSVGMVHTAHDSMGPDGVVFEREVSWTHGLERDTVESGRQFIWRSMRYFGRVCPPSAVYRSEALPAQPFDPRDGEHSDHTLHLRIALTWDIAYVARSGMIWRVHAGQSSLANSYIAPDGAWALHSSTIADMRDVKLRFIDEHARVLHHPRLLRRRVARFVDSELVRQARAEAWAGRDAVFRSLGRSARRSPTLLLRPEAWRLVIRTLAGDRGLAWFRRLRVLASRQS